MKQRRCLTQVPIPICGPQVQGRVLVPAAAMLEASRAAAQLLIDDTKASIGNSGDAVLLSASIPAPLILPGGGSSSNAAAAGIPVVRCTVSFGSGSSPPAVQLQSMSSSGSGSSAPATNLAAKLCSHMPQPALDSLIACSSLSSPALRLVLGSVFADMALPLSAFGSLLLEQQHATPGYHCHPAVLDAALHLGIFAAPDQQQGSGSPAPPRVPVAAGYYHAPAQGSGTASANWPVLYCDSATADATTASYALLGGTRTTSNGFQLHHLQSKSIRSRAAAAGLAGSVPQLASYRVKYAVHSVAEPAGSISASSRHPVASLADSSGRLSLRQRHSSISAGVFAGAQKALCFLQQQDNTTLQFTSATGALHPAAPSATGERAHGKTVLAASLQGMLKSAAAEAAASAALPSSWTCSHLHPAASPPGPAPESDVFAVAHQQQGAWLAPVLVEDQRQSASALPPVLLAPLQQVGGGRIAISGGMGSLGLLIASWLTPSLECCALSSGITLWGRSAAAALPVGLVSSSCQVTASQSNAAATSDMGAAADSQRRTTAYIHAGTSMQAPCCCPAPPASCHISDCP